MRVHPVPARQSKAQTGVRGQLGPNFSALTYPMTTGRNFAEILRLLDSCQLTAKAQVATPVNWERGDDVIIVPSVSDEAAAEKYPDGWVSPLPYLRLVKQPE